MPLSLPNLDRIAKDEIKIEEALKKVQDYTNQQVPTTPGNAVAAPPASTPPAPSQTVNPAPFPSARVPNPPVKSLIQG
jgi:hypothetical protein